MVKHHSEIISTVLTPAISFWVRSQLDHIDNFTIKIDAGDGQILRGKIDGVFVEAEKAIYQGIYVNKAKLSTEEIAVNLGKVLLGKPLKLLHPILVEGEIILTLDDIKESLKSELLTQGLIDLILLCLENQHTKESKLTLEKYKFTWHDIELWEDKFLLKGNIIDTNSEGKSIIISAGLTLKNENILLFNPIVIEGIPSLNVTINNFEVDLGNDVAIKSLLLTKTSLSCQGKIMVVS